MINRVSYEDYTTLLHYNIEFSDLTSIYVICYDKWLFIRVLPHYNMWIKCNGLESLSLTLEKNKISLNVIISLIKLFKPIPTPNKCEFNRFLVYVMNHIVDALTYIISTNTNEPLNTNIQKLINKDNQEHEFEVLTNTYSEYVTPEISETIKQMIKVTFIRTRYILQYRRNICRTLKINSFVKRRNAKIIQRYWKQAITNPRYYLCKRRLFREFYSLIE